MSDNGVEQHDRRHRNRYRRYCSPAVSDSTDKGTEIRTKNEKSFWMIGNDNLKWLFLYYCNKNKIKLKFRMSHIRDCRCLLQEEKFYAEWGDALKLSETGE